MRICPILSQAALVMALLLGACTSSQEAMAPPARLPPDATQGAEDPTRAAVENTAYVFGTPASVAGNPAAAARAVAQYEYLAVELPNGPRWREVNPIVSVRLAQGLREMRAALGIAPDAPPQPVIDSLYAAARALDAGDAAAARGILAPPLWPAGGAITLQRLAALPSMPEANAAVAQAAAELRRIQGPGIRHSPVH